MSAGDVLCVRPVVPFIVLHQCPLPGFKEVLQIREILPRGSRGKVAWGPLHTLFFAIFESMTILELKVAKKQKTNKKIHQMRKQSAPGTQRAAEGRRFQPLAVWDPTTQIHLPHSRVGVRPTLPLLLPSLPRVPAGTPSPQRRLPSPPAPQAHITQLMDSPPCTDPHQKSRVRGLSSPARMQMSQGQGPHGRSPTVSPVPRMPWPTAPKDYFLNEL